MEQESSNISSILDEDGVLRNYSFKKAWLRKRRRLGGGPPFLKIGRLVRYRREDIEEFLRSCKRG
jgi:hypothetical protein